MQKEEFDLHDDARGPDIRKIVLKALALWPWMLACVLLTVGITFTYLYFTNPLYKVNATILIKNNDQKMGGSSEMSMLQNIGLLGGTSSVDNELQILKSYTLMRKVVSDLQANVGFSLKSGFNNMKTVPLYGKDMPFEVNFVSFNNDALRNSDQEYEIWIKGKTDFVLQQGAQQWKGHWGDTLTLAAGKVVLQADANSIQAFEKEAYGMLVRDPEQVTAGLMKAMTTEIPNKQVSTINLTLETGVPAKGVDVLNKLIDVYMRANVDDNNRIADSTSAFIDVRLLTIGEELSGIEHDIQVFMQKNELANITEQSRVLIDNTGEYAKNLAQQEVQLSVVEALENYLRVNINNPRIVPASMMIESPALSSVIDKYNSMLLQRERMLLSSTEDNPMVKNLDGQLISLRGDLVANLISLKNSMQVAVNELRRKSGQLESQIRQVPAKEREFLDYSRQQSIKQELYLFLLQKREEAAISKSSTIANARIIDAAKPDNAPFKPKKLLFLSAAALLGILIPFGFVYIKELLNTRISSRDDIESVTDIPIIAEIGHNQEKEGVVVSRSSRSPISEQFRMLRTNLQYLLTNADEKIVLLTSSMPGEGKTFISTNLAAILALSGKRVALLELDLRKPKISQTMGLEGRKGFSNYAIGQASLDEIMIPVPDIENLYVMPSGPIPPNPAELLMMERTGQMFRDLREHFDYIIVDTTPNLVTDAQILSNYADATLYLVRVGVTHKDQLKLPKGLASDKKMPKINLVVNDVNYKKYGGYYGYSGYGYGYGYYAEEVKPAHKWYQFK